MWTSDPGTAYERGFAMTDPAGKCDAGCHGSARPVQNQLGRALSITCTADVEGPKEPNSFVPQLCGYNYHCGGVDE